MLLGHCHNAEHPAGRSGLPLDPAGWAALLPAATAYAEEELTAATAQGRLPRPGGVAGTEALGLVLDDGGAPPDPALLALAAGAVLRRNPLYVDGTRIWPHERWAAEYGPRAATYLPGRWAEPPVEEAVRRRLLLDLPETW